MRVEIDQDRCVAAGQCVAMAPDVFDQGDDDGIVILLEEFPAADQHDNVRRAAAACPALAIAFEE